MDRTVTVAACWSSGSRWSLPNEATRLVAGCVRADPGRGAAPGRRSRWCSRPRARRVAGGRRRGACSALLVVVKVLDMGFRRGRWTGRSTRSPTGPTSVRAIGVLGDSIGAAPALATAVVAAVLVVVALVVLMPLSVGRVTRVAQRHRRRRPRRRGARRGLGAVRGRRPAVRPAVRRSRRRRALGWRTTRCRQVRDGHRRPAGLRARDRGPTTSPTCPSDRLLTGLRGKDVLVVFVESYGRVAVQDSDFSPGVDAVLDDGTERLRGRRVRLRGARSSPRRRSARRSWLAHSTLQSGLWVDSQRRYDQLIDAGPADADRRVRAGRLAHRVRRTREHEDWPEGDGVLRLRRALRLPQRRLRRARSSATRTCRTSTRCPPSSELELRRATGRR